MQSNKVTGAFDLLLEEDQMIFKDIKKISQLDENDKDSIYTINAKIIEITRLQNVTIIIIDDEESTFKLVKYIPGSSPYPELVKDARADFSFKLNLYQNELQGQIANVKNVILPPKLEKEEIVESKFKREEFFNTEEWKKLNPMLKHTADIINQAITEKRPIIVSHHADCDGYCAAVILEQAILKKIEERQPSLRFINNYYSRNASKTPFYDISDATKDISFFQQNFSRTDNLTPLIIILDNGSTYEDILAIEKVKIFGADVVVIDHHDPGELDENIKSEICKLVKSHSNPHLVGLNKEFCTSMLSVGLVNQMDDSIELPLFTATLGGIADRCEGAPIKKFINFCDEDEEYLNRVAKIVNLEIFFTKYAYGTLPIFDLISKPNEKQKKLLELYEEFFQKEENEINLMIEKYIMPEKWNKFNVNLIDSDKLTLWNDYFSIGKLTGYSHRIFEEKSSDDEMITLGLSDSMVVYRVKQSNKIFDGNKLVSFLKKLLPYARISGGGHDVAGSVRFIPAAKDEVLVKIKEFIQNL